MGKCLPKPSKTPDATSAPAQEELKIEIKSAQEVSNPLNVVLREFLTTTLSDHSLFRGLRSTDLDLILNRLRFLVVPPNENIINQGETGNFFYILNGGEAEIYVSGDKVGEYSRGSCFGEIALLTNSRRKATIKCKTKCSLWAIDRITFKTALRSIHSTSQDSIQKLLFQAPFFAFLPESCKNQILQSAIVNDYVDQEKIVEEGQEAWFIYIIKSGIVKITVDGVDKGTLSEGQVFGEGALLTDDNKRAATVSSVGTTQIISVDQKVVKEIVGENYKEIFMKNIIINCLTCEESFKFFDIDIIKKLADIFSTVVLKKDEVAIKYVEDVKNVIYIVCYGKIESDENSYATYQLIGLGNSLAKKIGRFPYVATCNTSFAQVEISKIEEKLGFSIKYFKQELKNLYFIKGTYIFSTLGLQAIELICKNMKEVRFGRNHVIYNEEDSDDNIYIIKEGAVAIFHDKTLLFRLDKQSTFGESCLTLVSRQVSAKTLTKCVCYELHKDKFIKHYENAVVDKIKRKAYYEMPFTIGGMRFSEKISSSYNRDYLYSWFEERDTMYLVEIIFKGAVKNKDKFTEIVDEKCILVQLDNPHIPKLLRTFSDLNCVYFVYEYFPFEFLGKYKNNKFKEDEAKFIIMSLCAIIEYLSTKNILHRDISRNNIFIDARGCVWLFGFNFAKKVENRSYTMLDTTPEYRAKEVILGRGYSRASEFWSLGVILYELLTGELPFEIKYHDNPDEIAEKIIKKPLNIPNYIEMSTRNIIEGLLQELPAKRFQLDEIKESNWGKTYDLKDIYNNLIEGPFKPSLKPVNNRMFASREASRRRSSILGGRHNEEVEQIEWDEYF
ncbi:hypothetical protein SteCoe_13043 [Stentor coeruleus]|uniref:cGMP-dependent protein kinase n=1 Tax=Stentor coeruleus TaxID=5963 RepID=A0A1R2C9E9_9CILI|nr:hypothetical protein SteCoe_13043 [Stentor coeruleus]